MFAVALIIIGIVILWSNLTNYMRWMFPSDIYWTIVDVVPQLTIAVLLIWGGLNLIRGKKKELDDKLLEQEER